MIGEIYIPIEPLPDFIFNNAPIHEELVMIKKENQKGTEIDKTNDKAPYRSPQLVIYGDIREITQLSQKAPMSDNPGNENNMTA